ncbi:MAG: hypothetical protein AMS14_03505 [Planctomycetes bacterium DG_20]|nr:MAG: hypothetical protein AMS14_03505 [Planctomycetes bacterium DG_20]
MRRLTVAVIALTVLVAATCQAAVLTERWGVKGHVQHAGALRYESLPDGRTLMQFDLSVLPRGAKVYRARLLLTRPGLYGSAFDIVPAGPEGSGKADACKETGPQLEPVAPYYRWFDATAAVRQWSGSGRQEGLLLLRKAPDFQRDATCLEIAYEGDLRSPPKQVTGVRAFCRSGQVFLTFREIENYAPAAEDVTWGELGKRFSEVRYDGPVPRDDPHEVRYRVYAHDEPMTAATVGKARLLAEVGPGSIYNTRLVPGGDFIKRRPEAVALRLAIEPGKPLPPGSGLYVHTVERPGRMYYAVTSAVDGVENTVALSEANAAGPVDQRPGRPEPVLQEVPKAHGHENAGLTDLGDGKTYREQWYSYWAVPPEAPRPTRYDFAVGCCPQTLSRPAALEFTRGHTWGHTPEMPRPAPRQGIVMSMSADPPNGFWTGINDARETLRGIEEGAWRPFTHNRQEALIRWAQRKFDIDPHRLCAGVGAWGMWEFRRPDLYAYIHGWGMPEVTKGFQCWGWARGAWGPPEAYQGKPDGQNPYGLQDYTQWVLEDPKRELPYFDIHTGWGAHFTEMGWPPFPRFVRAMIDTKRAFSMQARAVQEAVEKGVIEFHRDASVPAFGNCSLDDNLGEGDLKSGTPFGQVNAYLLWETASIVDEPDRWEITAWLDASAPLDECTVDLTPRRSRAFRPEPGRTLDWVNTLAGDGKEIGSGRVAADRWGLATIRGLVVSKARHRIRMGRP